MNEKTKISVLLVTPDSDFHSKIYSNLLLNSSLLKEFNFLRLTNNIFSENGLIKINKQIEQNDFIVIDVSKDTFKEIYSLAYSYALNKKILLFSDNKKQIPFDLRYNTHVIYGENNIKSFIILFSDSLRIYVKKINSLNKSGEIHD